MILPSISYIRDGDSLREWDVYSGKPLARKTRSNNPGEIIKIALKNLENRLMTWLYYKNMPRLLYGHISREEKFSYFSAKKIANKIALLILKHRKLPECFDLGRFFLSTIFSSFSNCGPKRAKADSLKVFDLTNIDGASRASILSVVESKGVYYSHVEPNYAEGSR